MTPADGTTPLLHHSLALHKGFGLLLNGKGGGAGTFEVLAALKPTFLGGGGGGFF